MTLPPLTGESPEPDAPAAKPSVGALGADLSRPLAFVVLAVAYVASRAPFIDIGYGADPDAWRVALSAYWLRHYHEYYPSRLPGFPLPELASAAVIGGGWLATNALTLLVSLAGVWFFARIVKRLELPLAPVLVIGFAFTPLLWINSMNTMDYMWALTFILACYYCLLIRQVPIAGIMLGLAAASRPTSFVFIVPFSVYVVRDGRRGELREFIDWSIALPLVFYVPVVWRYGPGLINFYDEKVGYLNVLRLVAKDCLGLIGSIAVLAGAVLSLPRLVRLPSDAVRDKNVTVWVLIIVLTAIVFVRLPHESAFLIPMFPFGFFLMSRYFRSGAVVAAVAAILIAGFVDIGVHGADLNAHALRHARIGEGLVLADRSAMKAQLAFTRAIERQQIPDHSVVMLGRSYPQFAMLNRSRLQLGLLEKDTSSVSQITDGGKAVDTTRNITYVWLLDHSAFGRDLFQRFNVFYTADAARSAAALYGYRPGLYDVPGGVPVKPLDVSGEPPRAVGAADTAR